MSEPALSQKEQRVLAALITERSIGEAAAKARVGERTIYRWLSERPAFRTAYRNELRGLMAAVAGRVQGSALAALEALQRVLNDPDARPSERVSAAAKILDIAFRAHELGNIEQRLEALEQARGGGPSKLFHHERDEP